MATTAAGKIELDVYTVVELLDSIDDALETLKEQLREALVKARAADQVLHPIEFGGENDG